MQTLVALDLSTVVAVHLAPHGGVELAPLKGHPMLLQCYSVPATCLCPAPQRLDLRRGGVHLRAPQSHEKLHNDSACGGLDHRGRLVLADSVLQHRVDERPLGSTVVAHTRGLDSPFPAAPDPLDRRRRVVQKRCLPPPLSGLVARLFNRAMLESAARNVPASDALEEPQLCDEITPFPCLLRPDTTPGEHKAADEALQTHNGTVPLPLILDTCPRQHVLPQTAETRFFPRGKTPPRTLEHANGATHCDLAEVCLPPHGGRVCETALPCMLDDQSRLVPAPDRRCRLALQPHPTQRHLFQDEANDCNRLRLAGLRVATLRLPLAVQVCNVLPYVVPHANGLDAPEHEHQLLPCLVLELLLDPLFVEFDVVVVDTDPAPPPHQPCCLDLLRRGLKIRKGQGTRAA
eukprot:PhM_4_TR16545/c0_g1_i1/m.34252